jgi:inosine/xanthosine triphosphate pyrophosphatase family protein
MYQVSICPENEILHINKHTVEQAETCARDYYPHAAFMPLLSDDSCIVIYEKWSCEPGAKLNHVGNIWKL